MPSALTSHTGYLLRAVSNHVSGSFAARLAAKNTTVAEWVLLREVFDGDGLPPSQLATRMGLTRGGVTKLADRLIARGLLARLADDSDGRGQRLTLTDAGRTLVPELAAMADQNETALFGHLPPQTRAALDQMLRDLIRHHGLRTAPLD
jgi:DNA-binding MarR family transcriptional regulator